jgi:hypothetical protein
MCAQIGGVGALANVVSTAGTVFADIRLPGYLGSATDEVAVENFLLAQNTATGGADAAHSSGFGGGSACLTPP